MSNIMEVKGKRVIVTGAAFGIGKAMTEAFLESGAEVVIVDINETALKQTADDLKGEYIMLMFHLKMQLRRSSQLLTLLWVE
ncbi:MAG: hypothetical protein CM1200mP17_04420 [Woeseia sp.]|nr:MAG: hypothetical protein CM1200mP17_04420 [Woeseia sp.]